MRPKLNFYGCNCNSLYQVNNAIYIHLCFLYKPNLNYSRRETLNIALFSAYYTYAAGKEGSRELNAPLRTRIVLKHGSIGSYAPKEIMFLVSTSLAESGSHTFPLIVMFCDSPRCSYGYSKRVCEKFKYLKREEREEILRRGGGNLDHDMVLCVRGCYARPEKCSQARCHKKRFIFFKHGSKF